MTTATRILFDSTRPTNALRSFGLGILARSFWTGSYGWMPSEADAKWMATMSALDATEPTDADWDRIAAEQEWEEAYYELAALDTPSMCGCCGRSSDFVSADGLCPPCERLADEQGQGSEYLAATGRRMVC